MKIRFLIIILALVSLISSCDFFNEYSLFSTDVDTLLEIGDLEEQIDIDSSLIDMDTGEQSYVEEKVYNPDDNYFVVIGSFQNYEYAEKYAQRFREMGYNTEVLAASNGYYKVSAGSYSSYQDGMEGVRSIKAAEPVRAWLYKRN